MAKAALETVTSFESLIDYLRDELEWPLPENANIDNTTFTYTAAELGLKEDIVGGGVEFRQLRPMTTNQPWGIFFLNLPHKDLPQTLVRNILGKLTIKKRASANDPMRPAFAAHDLLFITSTGSAEERRLAFAHFQDDPLGGNAASLKVLGWEADDTPRRAELTQRSVEEKLAWPDDEKNADAWRAQWGSAFTDRPREAVRTSKELAKTLAALARRIRDRARELIKAQNDSGSLVKLHKAFKDALIHDLTPDAFADTYAQTITYGLLSTAMSRASGALTQDDMLLSVATTSPFLRDMLKTFIEAGGRKPGADGDGLDFDELGVGEVVEFLRTVNMKAVLADFDQKNSDKDPVIHLYELFIHEYDKAQKFQRGVFYTPRQVVGFIVRSVDEVLRTELGLEDGLASTDTWGDVIATQAAKGNVVALPEGVKPTDAFVRILDPATGTGTFLVETVDLIHKTMIAKWQKAGKSAKDTAALWNAYVPEHLLPRL
jgi:N-6 DNA Methylase